MAKRIISLMMVVALSMSMFMLVGCNDAEKKLQQQIDDLNAILTEQNNKINELENDKQELADLYEELQNKNTEQASKIEELQNQNTEQAESIEVLKAISVKQRTILSEILEADKDKIVQNYVQIAGMVPPLSVGYIAYNDTFYSRVAIRLAVANLYGYETAELYFESGYREGNQYKGYGNNIIIEKIDNFNSIYYDYGKQHFFLPISAPTGIFNYNYSDVFIIPQELFIDDEGCIFYGCKAYETNSTEVKDVDIRIYYKKENNKITLFDKDPYQS